MVIAASLGSILIPFIFAMPFLVHPIVFFMFGRAMHPDGEMPRTTALIIALIGLAGLVFALLSWQNIMKLVFGK